MGLKMANHVSKEIFLSDFFGPLGRELGNPKQFYVDNPKYILEFIKISKEKKQPAFISVQPRSAHYKVAGIEKIFYDFDYADKTFIKKLREVEKLPEDEIEKILQIRKTEMPFEVIRFVNNLVSMNLTPLIIKTRKGYHVYLYFDRIYEIDDNIDFWKAVYGMLFSTFSKDGSTYKYIDSSSDEDIFRMSRIPFSIHEKSGEECIIVDTNLKPTKVRGLGHYRNHCLRKEDLLKAVKNTRRLLLKKALVQKLRDKSKPKSNYSGQLKYSGTLRPCFLKALKDGEMAHYMRLALLLESWYKGKQTRQELIDVFKPLNDFDGDNVGKSKCRDQIDWFLEHKIYQTYKPYSCLTLQKNNWCIQDECEIWKKREEVTKNGSTKSEKKS